PNTHRPHDQSSGGEQQNNFTHGTSTRYRDTRPIRIERPVTELTPVVGSPFFGSNSTHSPYSHAARRLAVAGTDGWAGRVSWPGLQSWPRPRLDMSGYSTKKPIADVPSRSALRHSGQRLQRAGQPLMTQSGPADRQRACQARPMSAVYPVHVQREIRR